MITLDLIAGHLALLRFDNAFTVADVAKMRSRIIEIFAQKSGKIAFFSDLRDATQLAPTVEGPLIQVLQADNPRVERNALLVTRGTPFALQALRIVQTAESRARRVFTERKEAEAWIADVLDGAERLALKDALDRR